MHDLAFWQEDTGGGGGETPADQFFIAWDADQITGDDGKFTAEMPLGSPGSATGTWADSDASAAAPVQEIYFRLDHEGFTLGTALTGASETSVNVGRPPGPNVPPKGTLRITDDSGAYRFLAYSSFSGSTFTLASAADFSVTAAPIGSEIGVVGRRIEVTGHSSFDAMSGVWDLTHSDFALADDAQAMISYITDFNDTQAYASVLFLLRHQDVLQSIAIPAPTRHPNFRDSSSGLEWEFVTAYSTPKPSWEWDDKDTQYQLTTTGYGGHIKIPASFLAPTARLVASTGNGYAGKACEPRFSVACPEGQGITFQVTKAFADGVTPSEVNEYTYNGPIDWTGRADEINITLPKVELEAGDRIDIRFWSTTGADSPLMQYSDLRIVEQGADAPFADTKGIFVDPVNGDDATAQFGNVNRPYRSFVAFSRDSTQATFPTGTAEDPINVYLPRGMVAEWADGVQEGDACYLKNNTFHLQPWPGTSGQAPTIYGRAKHPVTSIGSYGTQQVGLITLRSCTDSIVEDMIVEDASHCGIVVEVNNSSGLPTDNVVIRNCISKRSGADGVLIRGAKTSGQSATDFAGNPATNIRVENVTITEANWGLQSAADVGSATGQALTVSSCVGVTVMNCSATNYRKEGFDVISSRNVSFIDCYAKRDPASEYGGDRGTAFYNDSQAEGCRDILFDRCTCEGDASGAVMGSERGGECTRIVFRNMSITGVNTGIVIPGPIDSEVASYTDCAFEHCSVVAGSGYFAVRVTTLGDPVGVAIDNCIFSGDRADLFSKTTTNWPTFGTNIVHTTNPAGHTGTEPGTMTELDPQFVSATDLTPQNAAVLGQITPPIRSVNIANVAVSDPDNYGAY